MSAQDIGADELLARLSGNDPRVHVADPDPAVRAVWRRAIDAVRREHLTPPGMRLRHTGRDRGDLVIWLEPVEQAPPVRPDRLLVPSEVVEAHPLLGSPEELGRHLDVEPASLPRALRLLQVFVEAAEARRYTVAWAAAFSTLALERDGHTETVECGEEREHRAVAPTAAELGDKAPRYSWQRVQTEQRWVATGRLCMQLGDDGDRRGRRRRWADRTRWRLEDKLADVLAEVDRRVDDAVARRQAQQEQSRQREVRWHEAIEHARRAFGEQRRRDELLRQVEAWHECSPTPTTPGGSAPPSSAPRCRSPASSSPTATVRTPATSMPASGRATSPPPSPRSSLLVVVHSHVMSRTDEASVCCVGGRQDAGGERHGLVVATCHVPWGGRTHGS